VAQVGYIPNTREPSLRIRPASGARRLFTPPFSACRPPPAPGGGPDGFAHPARSPCARGVGWV